jgi:L,D-transpeptidase catalytic domain
MGGAAVRMENCGAFAMGSLVRNKMARPRWVRGQVTQLLFALLLLGLLAGCTAGGQAGGSKVSPTTTVPAAAQDLIPTPNATPAARAPVTAHRSVPGGIPQAPYAKGRVLLVSLARQQLFAYDNGAFVFTMLVETGRPELPTPTGVYHVLEKACSDLRWLSNSAPTSMHNPKCTEHNGDGFQEVFASPWPEGSPYWYAPTHINYALRFRWDGFYLHDAWWHVNFGPGSNVPHQLPNGHWETGSHGCVGMPIASAEQLYAWTPLGTPVYIQWNA